MAAVDRSWSGAISGSLLRYAREAAHVTVDAVARRGGFSRSHLSNVEAGRRSAGPDVVDAYLAALGMNRRQLLALSATMLAAGPDPDLWERLVTSSATSTVDVATVGRLSATLAAQRRAEDTSGGVALLPAVRGQLDAVTRLIPQATGDQADRLLVLAAEHAHWLSWVAHGQDQVGSAHRWLDLAHGWATDAGSVDMLSWIMRVRAFYRMRGGDAHRALRAADIARGISGVCSSTAAIATHTAAMAAAGLGNFDRCLRLAHEAHQLAHRDGDRPGWLYFLDRPRADLMLGDAALAAGDAATAVDAFRRGLPGVVHMPRDHAYYVGRLNQAISTR